MDVNSQRLRTPLGYGSSTGSRCLLIPRPPSSNSDVADDVLAQVVSATRIMAGNADVSLGAANAGGTRLVSEPAFELLLSEIIAYTGAYVAHSAASHATDMRRTSPAGVVENEDEDGEGAEAEDGEDRNGKVLLEPSPASVGAGSTMLPVSSLLQRTQMHYEML